MPLPRSSRRGVREGRPSRGTPERTQQRRDSFRHLLSPRIAEGEALRGRRRSHGRLLPRARHRARDLRQGDCRHQRARVTAPGRVVAPRPGQQRARSLHDRPRTLRELEPHAAGIRALHVPGTGITDYAAVARKYAEIVQASGGVVLTGTEVVEIERRGGGSVVETTRGDYEAGFLVNCAGLYSDRVACMAGAETDVRIVPFRGEYYEIAPARRDLVRGLIYPMPDPDLPFLGVHFTRRVDGSVEAGPNAGRPAACGVDRAEPGMGIGFGTPRGGMRAHDPSADTRQPERTMV